MVSISPNSNLVRFNFAIRSARLSNSISISQPRSSSQFSGYKLTKRSVRINVIDENFTDFQPFFENDYDLSSDLNEAEESDNDDYDDESYVYPYMDLDLPSDKQDNNLQVPDASLPVALHGLSNYGRKQTRIREGMVLNLYLIAFITIFLLYFDSFSWKIVRLPLKPYFLTKPFIISTATSAISGLFYIPILDYFKIHHIIDKQGTNMKIYRRVVPTMGGLFVVLIGIINCRFFVDNFGNYNLALFGTICFGIIGFLDDILRGVNCNYRLFGWLKLILQISIGALFSYWLNSTNIPTPYTMKYLVPMPPPIGLQNLGNIFYFAIVIFCFGVSGNGARGTGGVDGLAVGISALSFFGMSIAVLPLSPELSIFGASMAGSLTGFLFHNGGKSSVLMGEIGILGIAGALASIASITGMFLPLFVATGLYSLHFFTAILQGLYYKFLQKNKHFWHKSSIIRKLKLFGLKDPLIIGILYSISYLLALLAAYLGLISA